MPDDGHEPEETSSSASPPRGSDLSESPRYYRGRVSAGGGQPVRLTERRPIDSLSVDEATRSQVSIIRRTLIAYRDAARELLQGRYRDLGDVAPPHLRVVCDAMAILCDDGVLIRWDRHAADDPKVRVGFPRQGGTVTSMVPGFSDGYVYCPPDRAAFKLPPDGPRLFLARGEPGGELTPLVDVAIGFVADWTELRQQSDSTQTRPVPLVSLTSEMTIQLSGEEYADTAEPVQGEGQPFLLVGQLRLVTGWEAFEVYPPFDANLWQPNLAPMWAEMDLLGAATRQHLLDRQLQATRYPLDSP